MCRQERKDPEYAILTNRKDLVALYPKHNEKIVTKNWSQGVTFVGVKKQIAGGVQLITDDFIKETTKNFYPTFIQAYTPKLYELRIFYLNEKLFCSAIFSQSNEKTKVDFRNYDHNRPNRVVSYELPESIKSQLIKFMKKIKVNTGSIDMIYTPMNEYIFLEFNPIGQFIQVETPCNYPLSKEIAKYLSYE